MGSGLSSPRLSAIFRVICPGENSETWELATNHSLLKVIHRIGEYSRVKSMHDPIQAFNYDAIDNTQPGNPHKTLQKASYGITRVRGR
jgi:hypothetical protein